MTLVKKAVVNEPVMSAAFGAGFLIATANLLRTFGVYDITQDQQQAVLDYTPYVVAVLGFGVRQLVKPTAKIEAQTTPVYGNEVVE